jgi:glucosamine--fructose-6-phosphate aminotransferase (isomerizing)
VCGIVAVVYDASDVRPPDGPQLVDEMRSALRSLTVEAERTPRPAEVERVAGALARVDDRLRGIAGVRCLLGRSSVAEQLAECAEAIERQIGALESALQARTTADDDVERLNAATIALQDAWWSISRDRLRFAAEVDDLAGSSTGWAARDAYAAIQVGLSALDRLELRGRDSVGLHVLVTGHGLDFDDPATAAAIARRNDDPLFTSTAVRTPAGHLSIVYKHAAEIGRLGDNGRALRAAIADDSLLFEALQAPTAHVVVVGHTRWASIGMINQANAHPLTSEELPGTSSDPSENYVVAALNGDVDNYAELIERHGLGIAPEITTDAKVIPVLVGRRIGTDTGTVDAFRHTVSEFEGSVAIAANCADEPGRVLLAQRGSGQSLLVGAVDGMTIAASELYGLVEHCRDYVRLDGTTGEVVTIDGEGAGRLHAMGRWAYDGSPRPITDADVATASITTRDIDRRDHAHFLEKELHESPDSMQKTLRGRIANIAGMLRVSLGDNVIPSTVATGLADGRIRRIIVIGQGTAAVAGRAVAAAVQDAFSGDGPSVTATTASELSGFHLVPDMSDALVIAISQSGTTTDTNRAVDIVRRRGAIVIAIVNRRGSDLTQKADGVLYTADGRDIEMSVASTKAFYAQIAAGTLLARALARAAERHDDDGEHDLLTGLASFPDAMRRLLDDERRVAALATSYAPQRASWAVVGSARNRIAAEEIRIKCSELTYRSISCDESSDKKHIDLSAEPLTLVCAAGMTGSAADDVAKEVEIFASHNGLPIVIATEGESRFHAAAGVIWVPRVHPELAFLLAAMAGHLFGYHAALAIDEQALPLKAARAAIERCAAANDREPMAMLDDLADAIGPAMDDFSTRLSAGRYDGSLSASASARIAIAFRAIAARSEGLLLSGNSGPETAVNELASALTEGIDQVSRTIDTIRHQAKTVTVGTSRSDEEILTVPLVEALLQTGADRNSFSYHALRTVATLDPAVSHVVGSTRYAVADQYVGIVSRRGVSEGLHSRTDVDHQLLGTKLMVVEEQQVLAAVGRRDLRPFILVPEVVDRKTIGLVLLHVEFRDRLPATEMSRVHDGYRGRVSALRSAVTEVRTDFDETLLGALAPQALLTEPVESLAEQWTGADLLA